eukprot:GEMP01029714.1.p1 GENE.GEMP01029714.1~~GEMP01029714.1.p1  ORF type:complete len:587 (+),score=113.61 GEMP01029714.1:183-1943(+)
MVSWLHVIAFALAQSAHGAGTIDAGERVKRKLQVAGNTACGPGACKTSWINDGTCDKDLGCFVAECNFDGDDCVPEWERKWNSVDLTLGDVATLDYDQADTAEGNYFARLSWQDSMQGEQTLAFYVPAGSDIFAPGEAMIPIYRLMGPLASRFGDSAYFCKSCTTATTLSDDKQSCWGIVPRVVGGDDFDCGCNYRRACGRITDARVCDGIQECHWEENAESCRRASCADFSADMCAGALLVAPHERFCPPTGCTANYCCDASGKSYDTSNVAMSLYRRFDVEAKPDVVSVRVTLHTQQPVATCWLTTPNSSVTPNDVNDDGTSFVSTWSKGDSESCADVDAGCEIEFTKHGYLPIDPLGLYLVVCSDERDYKTIGIQQPGVHDFGIYYGASGGDTTSQCYVKDALAGFAGFLSESAWGTSAARGVSIFTVDTRTVATDAENGSAGCHPYVKDVLGGNRDVVQWQSRVGSTKAIALTARCVRWVCFAFLVLVYGATRPGIRVVKKTKVVASARTKGLCWTLVWRILLIRRTCLASVLGRRWTYALRAGARGMATQALATDSVPRRVQTATLGVCAAEKALNEVLGR